MRFDIITLFPETVECVLNESIIGRAREKGILDIRCIQLRDYAFNKHRKVDDYPYGGGFGMVMQAEPIYQAYKAITENLDYKPYTIYMSPQGKTFRQSTAKKLAKKEHIVILCGHYEGVDQRILDEIVDDEISIGDFVLTGGEIAAMAVVDSVSRMVDGVLREEGSYSEESHFNGLLEYPQYTRPEIWNGKSVPDVLLCGNHKLISEWKRKMSILNTFKKRRGMLSKAKLTEKETELVEELKRKKQL